MNENTTDDHQVHHPSGDHAPPAAAPKSIAPLFFVINPKSGQIDVPTVTQAIERILGQAGCDYKILVADAASPLATLARQAVLEAVEKGGGVVAVGGDGTMNAVAQVAIEHGCPFGLLPQGTFNYFSRSHGIDLELEPGVQALLDAETVAVQVGTVNGRAYLVNASLGLYPTLLQDRENYKKQWGRYRWVAMLAALLTILRHDTQLRIKIDLPGSTRTMRTPTLFVCNNSLQLEQLGLPLSQALEQGQLAAIALKPSGRMALLWLLVRGAFGRLGDAGNVISFPFRKMIVATRHRRRIRVATDGEVTILRTPLEFAVSPRPLLLLCPRRDPAP